MGVIRELESESSPEDIDNAVSSEVPDADPCTMVLAVDALVVFSGLEHLYVPLGSFCIGLRSSSGIVSSLSGRFTVESFP